MSPNNETAKDRYRDKTKRVSVLKENYITATEYKNRRLKDKPEETFEPNPIANKENQIFQESFKILLGTDSYEDPVIDRISLFAERNDITKTEAMELIVCTVLDDQGRVEETFRKPRLFENKFW